MEELENVESGIVSLLAKFLSPEVLTFFGSLGVWGWVGIGVVLLLVGIGSYFLIRWVKNKAIERAAKKTEENRGELETKLPGQQSRLEQGARNSLERLREWLKKKK